MYFCNVDLLRQKDKNKKTKIEFFYYIIIGSLKKKDGFSKTYKKLIGISFTPILLYKIDGKNISANFVKSHDYYI